MKTSLTPLSLVNTNDAIINVEQDGVYINRSVNTARVAAKYASQLSHEYHHILHSQLKKSAPDLAARFTPPITELTTMTDATYENVRLNRK